MTSLLPVERYGDSVSPTSTSASTPTATSPSANNNNTTVNLLVDKLIESGFLCVQQCVQLYSIVNKGQSLNM